MDFSHMVKDHILYLLNKRVAERELDMDDALIKCYDDGARSEALLRAFIAERNREPHHTEFLVNFYRLIVQQIAFAESPSGPSRA